LSNEKYDWRRKGREIQTVGIMDSFQTEKMVAVYFGETSTKFNPYNMS
jgi:hypothetical protein